MHKPFFGMNMGGFEVLTSRNAFENLSPNDQAAFIRETRLRRLSDEKNGIPTLKECSETPFAESALESVAKRIMGLPF